MHCGYRVLEADLERDRREIASVWARNFPAYTYEQHQDRFLWNYAHGPFGPGHCWLLLHGDSVVGTAGLGFRRLYFEGMPALAGVASDLAVDASHRSLQPALMLEKAVTGALGCNLRALYGTPNNKSEALFRRLQYEPVGTVVRWVKVLRSARFVHRIESAPLRLVSRAAAPALDFALRATSRETWRFAGNPSVCEVADFDARFDDLWNRTVNAQKIASCRTARFLTWRYSRYPLMEYSTLALLNRAQDVMFGYCVLYACGQEGVTIADFWTDPECEHSAEDLLTGVIHWCRARKAAYLAVTFRDGDPLGAVIHRFGFVARHQDGTVMARSSPASLIQALGRWCFLPADEDYN